MTTLSLALGEEDVQRIANAVAALLLANRPTQEAHPSRSPNERMTVAEVAKELRCSDRQVRRLISTGRIRVAKISHGGSGRVLIARAELQRFLREAGEP